MFSASGKPWTDDLFEGDDLGLRHIVAAGKVVRREQEYIVNTGFLARTQKSLRTTLR